MHEQGRGEENPGEKLEKGAGSGAQLGPAAAPGAPRPPAADTEPPAGPPPPPLPTARGPPPPAGRARRGSPPALGSPGCPRTASCPPPRPAPAPHTAPAPTWRPRPRTRRRRGGPGAPATRRLREEAPLVQPPRQAQRTAQGGTSRVLGISREGDSATCLGSLSQHCHPQCWDTLTLSQNLLCSSVPLASPPAARHPKSD